MMENGRIGCSKIVREKVEGEEIIDKPDGRENTIGIMSGKSDDKLKEDNIKGKDKKIILPSVPKNTRSNLKRYGLKGQLQPSLAVPKNFANISKEKLLAITKKGGRAGLGKKKLRYTKCINCEARNTCKRAFEEKALAIAKGERFLEEGNENAQYYLEWKDEWARCIYEIEGRADIKRGKLFNVKAFVSSDPTDLLDKMHVLFAKLEDNIDGDPSYSKLLNAMYLLQNIYKMKFGEKVFSVSLKGNVEGESSMDIKELMKKMRAVEKEDKEAVDVEAKEVKGDKTGGDVP